MENKCDILIVIPFYNEQLRLPEILKSLIQSASNKYKIHLIGVNHLSTDNSNDIVNRFSKYFFRQDIVVDNFPIRCGGHPRNVGINFAINMAENQYMDNAIPIATVDADVIVPKHFISESIDKLKNGYDIVTFSERYNSSELLRFIKKQNNYDLAIKGFVGLNWFRYQILCGLINSGIKETRGPGGYSIKADTMKSLGHKQPFDSYGNPITGENNRLGIIANRRGLRVYSSPYYSQVHPRRDIATFNDITQKGYSKNFNNAEVFRLARELNQYPLLTVNQINNYLINGLKRTIRMILIRAIAYNNLNTVKKWFHHSAWEQMIELSFDYINSNNPSEEKLELVGSEFYNNLYDSLVFTVEENNMKSFIKYLEEKIPDNNSLETWINDQSLIIKPDLIFT